MAQLQSVHARVLICRPWVDQATRTLWHWIQLAVGLAACFAFAGCSSHAHRIRDARHAYFANDLATASTLLAEAENGNPGERDCLVLDRALVSLAEGHPESAEQLLRDVRNRFDHLEQSSVAEAGLSWMTDDTTAAYAGEDYEKIMIRAMLAISNLMHDGSDAVAYCLQVDQKQNEVLARLAEDDDKPTAEVATNVAIGAYIRGVVQEESHVNYDDAERAFALVTSIEPQFQHAQFDLERAKQGTHSAKGNGVVYVFAFVGRGPYKEEAIADVTSDALLAADRMISAVGDHSLPPTIAPVKIPTIVTPTNVIDAVAVDVNGSPAALTECVTSVSRLAVAQFERERSDIIARAVARRVLKKAAIYLAKDSLDAEGDASNLFFDAAGVLWEASESADTRCWGLLPESIQVVRLELPVGTHNISLSPARHGQPIGLAHSIDVDVVDGRNTYVQGTFPTQQLVGKLLTSQPARSSFENRVRNESAQASIDGVEPSENAAFMIR